jgi:hypothetical protein
MEKVVQDYISIQNDQQIQKVKEEAKRQTQNVEFLLQSEQENFAKFMGRRVVKDDPGQLVYIYRESEFKHKIGESINITKRESSHRSSNSSGMVVYTKRCCDRKLLERVVHHILDEFRDNSKREWFTVDFDTAKAALDSAEKWKKITSNNQDYEMNAAERKRVDWAFKERFLHAVVYSGKQNDHGYFGITLKDDKSFIGFKLANSLKKQIIKIDINTKEILETYESLTECAKKHNRSCGKMSADINFKKLYDNIMFQYVKKN